MKIRLKTMWNGMPAGRELDLGKGQAVLLIQRNVAEEINDQDGDGKAESGVAGTVKAFFNPPSTKRKGK